MAKKLNQQDLLKLTSIGTPPTDSVAFAAKSDGLYQKIETVEEKLSTESFVNNAINNLEIGGRNYFKDTQLITYPSGFAKPIVQNGDISSITFNWDESQRYTIEGLFPSNGAYVISGYYSQQFSAQREMRFFLNNSFIGSVSSASGVPVRFEISVTVANYEQDTIGLAAIGGTNPKILKFKLEKGTIPTDWTPAPEDQVSDWNTTDVNSFSFIKNKPSTFTPSAHKHPTTDITGLGNIATINKNNSTANYLRGDGTWVTPPNKTYGVATTSANGLMSSTDKSKLNGIATGANKYSLPTASDTVLGGIKVGSRLSISSGSLSANIQSDNNFTNAYKTKLDGIATGATSLSLGATSSTAYRGDRGTIAYNHSQSAHDYLPLSGGTLTGDIEIGTVGVSKNLRVYGNITVTNAYKDSDICLKTNIKDINNSLIDRVNLVEFDWKKDGRKDYGVIAQEVEKYYPELVNTDEDGMKQVNYESLYAIKISRLEERIKELEDKLWQK